MQFRAKFIVIITEVVVVYAAAVAVLVLCYNQISDTLRIITQRKFTRGNDNGIVINKFNAGKGEKNHK